MPNDTIDHVVRDQGTARLPAAATPVMFAPQK